MKLVPIVDWNRGVVFVNPEFVQAVAANGSGALITMRDYILIAKDTPESVVAKLEGMGSN